MSATENSERFTSKTIPPRSAPRGNLARAQRSAKPGRDLVSSVFGALAIRAIGRRYHDAPSGDDVGRHHGANAVGQLRRLERTRRGLAFDDRLGFEHLERDLLRQLDGDRI